MLGDKRGLSTIVVTLIIILISLVAVGIVWAVVSNLINTGSQNIAKQAQCTGVDMEVVGSPICTPLTGGVRYCNATIQRQGTDSNAVGGIEIYFDNATTGAQSTPVTIPGNVALLNTVNTTATTMMNTTFSTADELEVTAYLTGTGGSQTVCTQTVTPFKLTP